MDGHPLALAHSLASDPQPSALEPLRLHQNPGDTRTRSIRGPGRYENPVDTRTRSIRDPVDTRIRSIREPGRYEKPGRYTRTRSIREPGRYEDPVDTRTRSIRGPGRYEDPMFSEALRRSVRPCGGRRDAVSDDPAAGREGAVLGELSP
ncbi:unnamed protein product [Gadus morhua 'NCC']